MCPDESDCGAGWQNLRPIAESALLFPDTVTVTSGFSGDFGDFGGDFGTFGTSGMERYGTKLPFAS